MSMHGRTATCDYQDLIRPVPTWTVAPDPASVALARHLVAKRLIKWHLDALLDDAVLIVSELVANAVRFGCTVRLAVHAVRVCGGAKRLRIEVSSPTPADHAEVPATPVLPDLEAEHGRGLFLVDMLTSDWGCESRIDSTLVWAELPITNSLMYCRAGALS